MAFTSMLLLLVLSDSPLEEPKVYTDLAAAQKKAEETQKPILIYVYDSI